MRPPEGQQDAPGHGAQAEEGRNPSSSLHSVGALNKRSIHTFHSPTPRTGPGGRAASSRSSVCSSCKEKPSGPRAQQAQGTGRESPALGHWGHRALRYLPSLLLCLWRLDSAPSNTKNTICDPDTKGETSPLLFWSWWPRGCPPAPRSPGGGPRVGAVGGGKQLKVPFVLLSQTFLGGVSWG